MRESWFQLPKNLGNPHLLMRCQDLQNWLRLNLRLFVELPPLQLESLLESLIPLHLSTYYIDAQGCPSQVRQYSAKALGAFGAASKECLKDLDDLNNSSVEKDYVKRSVNASIKIMALSRFVWMRRFCSISSQTFYVI